MIIADMLQTANLQIIVKIINMLEKEGMTKIIANRINITKKT
jgi:predicted methyltransferase